MQPFFVNLPLGYIARDRWYLEQFLDRGLAPELGLDTPVMACLDEQWHRAVAGEFASAGLACAMHLPFFDLQPGSLDDFILDATRRRLESVKTIVAMYQPRHLVAHAGYTAMYADFYDAWLERAVETWSRFMDGWPGHPTLFLENVYETETKPLADLFAGLAGRNACICFDAGHWQSFAGGQRAGSLREWVTRLAPFIGHLHLHDNDGTCDQHLGLGQGSIPWEELFAALAQCPRRPTITLEPHTARDVEVSLRFMEKHPEWFA